jgi:hypothetical protein
MTPGRTLSLLLPLLQAGLAAGQFTGGVSDGASNQLLAQITCAAPGPMMSFFGGVSDGSSANVLSQSSCGPVEAQQAYYGGNNDGSSANLLSQSNCAPIVAQQAYYGGNDDGASANVLSQSNCAPVAAQLAYYGGDDDGASANVLSQSNCAPVPAQLAYFGGDDDGASANVLSQSNCAPVPAQLAYFGGDDDGASSNLVTQSACAPPLTLTTYLGRPSDGFDRKVLQQVICEGITPLPIELVSFGATCEEEGVLLEWTTASELNNDHFTIERSSDVEHWEEVGIVPGAGNNSSLLHYSLMDEAPLPGIIYYRLKQTDLDGTFEHSDMVPAQCANGNTINALLYPNPTLEDITLEIPGGKEPLSYTVYNAMGAQVGSGSVTGRSVLHAAELADGMYVIRLQLPSAGSGPTWQELRFVKH